MRKVLGGVGCSLIVGGYFMLFSSHQETSPQGLLMKAIIGISLCVGGAIALCLYLFLR